MLEFGDTIAAIATASGRAAIGVLRVSGPMAAEIADVVTRRDLRGVPRRLTLCTARRPDGQRIDEVLAVLMPGPNSFTGEDVLEIHGHGGGQVMRELLAATIAAGARPAEAGEFTRRAFESGRMDLTQAEGILGVIAAESERGLRVAQTLLAGDLRAEIESLRDDCSALLARYEASIDFPEDVEVGEWTPEVRSLHERLAALASTASLGNVLRDGISVALVGDTNAGKSSLFNRLVGRERALVAEEPGTTRDFVEASVEWQGILVTLIDTAGTRVADGVESRGIVLGQERAAECDVELVVVESGRSAPTLDRRQMLVWSKCDLLPLPATAEGMATSAETGDGVAALKLAIVEKMGAASQGERVVLVGARQHALAREAATAAARALSAANRNAAAELIAADLQNLQSSIARLLGEEVSDEMLDSLFAQFCIGK